MNRPGYLLQNLARYDSIKLLHDSGFFKECRREIEAILTTPRVLSLPSAKPRVESLLRVMQWNIEKGRHLSEIIGTCRGNEILKWADIILLNEADCGMARSDNLHVAEVLADAQGMNMAFAPAHFELTKGTGEDLEQAGENLEGLQGNAVLSRYPILDARVVRLPACFEPFEFHEKRYGGRNCVWAKLQIGRKTLWAGSVHLEVRNTPRCRDIQMRHLLAHLPGEEGDSYLLGGDLNTNTFSRGTHWRTISSVRRLIARSPSELADELRHPEREGEPLFRAAGRAGFCWEGLNSDEETACSPIGDLEDARMIPGFIVRWVNERIKALEGYLSFRLDWLLGKRIRGLGAGEVMDPGSGICSIGPGVVRTVRRGILRVSDHSPIYADIRIV